MKPGTRQLAPLVGLAASGIAGLVGFGLVFADAPTPELSTILAIVVAIGASFSLAAVFPRHWWWVAILSSWGSVTWAIMGVLMRQSGLQYLLLALPLALAAGYTGSRIGRADGRDE